eukprot:scaffold261179_cov24-Tisochrysis_lutea.AAC.1
MADRGGRSRCLAESAPRGLPRERCTSPAPSGDSQLRSPLVPDVGGRAPPLAAVLPRGLPGPRPR